MRRICGSGSGSVAVVVGLFVFSAVLLAVASFLLGSVEGDDGTALIKMQPPTTRIS